MIFMSLGRWALSSTHKRLGSCLLATLFSACGGRAERITHYSTGSGGSATAGAGGRSGDGGGPVGSGGTSFGGSIALAGGPSGGNAGGGDVLLCNGSKLTSHDFAANEKPVGFVGDFDGAPVNLQPVDPSTVQPQRAGTVRSDAISCRSTISFNVYLQFDAPYTDETLSMTLSNDGECSVSAAYWPVLNKPFSIPVDIDLTLETWVPASGIDENWSFLRGQFTAVTDGPAAHTISGTFEVESAHWVCLL